MTKFGVLYILGIYFVYLETWIFVDAVIGTALYCRDPDTGKLHAPNTTWPSTTFCGNYACRLKKKNESTIEYTPNPPKNTSNSKTKYDINMDHFASRSPMIARKDNFDLIPESHKILEQKEAVEPKVEPTIAKPNIINIHENPQNVKLRFQISKLEDALGDNDRYLSEDEIKLISDLLYTVKKSDLEAIVDIYNLAQEIYNEMERPQSDEITNLQKKKDSNKNGKPNVQLETAINKNSYWYEPLQNYAVKSENHDLAVEASNVLYSSPASVIATTQNPQIIKPKVLDDFRKLPYNSPVSNFHTSVVQVKPEKIFIPPQILYANKEPIRPVQQEQRVFAPLWYQSKTQEKIVVPTKSNILESPFLLPYPFSHVRYNLTSVPTPAYYGMNPYHIDINKNNQNTVQVNTQPQISFNNPTNKRQDTGNHNHRKSLEKFFKGAQWSANNNVPDRVYLLDKKHTGNKVYTSEHKYIPENEYAAEYKYSIDNKIQNVPKAESKAWITDPLPEHVIEAIRAKINPRPFKSYFPHKRMVQIESHARGTKQNENRKRSKRDQGSEDYEAVIEKKTCISDESPGFFRKGNESEPYPKCCPQRIKFKLQEVKDNIFPFQ